MKELINLAIYGLGTLVIILLLIYGAETDVLSSNAIGIFAILSVVVLPVVIILFMAKREKKS